MAENRFGRKMLHYMGDLQYGLTYGERVRVGRARDDGGRTVGRRDIEAGVLASMSENERAREAGLGARRRSVLYDIREALKRKRLVREYGGIWFAERCEI